MHAGYIGEARALIHPWKTDIFSSGAQWLILSTSFNHTGDVGNRVHKIQMIYIISDYEWKKIVHVTCSRQQSNIRQAARLRQIFICSMNFEFTLHLNSQLQGHRLTDQVRLIKEGVERQEFATICSVLDKSSDAIASTHWDALEALSRAQMHSSNY